MGEVDYNKVQALYTRWSGALGEWLGHRSIPPMAAALAYRTVFSIIPICIIAVVVVQRFINKQSVVDDLFARVMTWLGVADIGLDGQQRGELFVKIQELVGSLDNLSFTGIGIVSGLTLIYAALSLVIELEGAFNRLYAAPRGRSLVRRIMQYWLLISLGPVLLAGSFIAADRITGLANDVTGNALLGVAGFVSSVAISTLALWILYMTIPNARVKPLAALQGAVAAAVALEAAKWGFQLYLERAALKTLYGSLALIPIFLLWVYVTWVIVLTGLRVSYLVQHGRRVTLVQLAGGGRGSGSFTDPSYALPVAAVVAGRFAKGEQASVEGVAEEIDLADQHVRLMLDRLVVDGVLLKVEGNKAGGERYTLSRPAENIPQSAVLRSGFVVSGTVVPKGVEAMRKAQIAAVEGRTLAELLPAGAVMPVVTPVPEPAGV